MIQRLAALILLATFCGCGGMYFHPSNYADPRFEPVMTGAGLNYEAVTFRSSDGTELRGIFFPSTATANGTIVHFHGNGQNMTSHAFQVAWLAKDRYNVFVFDYRGYGASDGKPSISGAVEDGAAALRYVRSRPGVDPERIVVFGQSLGGALAIASVAKENPSGVKAVVVEGTFASYRALARDKLNDLWLTWPLQYPLSYFFPDSMSAKRFVKQIAPRPLLVIHGDADRVVPLKHGLALYDEAADPKQLWQVPGAGHLGIFYKQSGFADELRPRLVEFLDNVLAPAAGGSKR